MAEVIGILSALFTAGNALGKFAGQIENWRLLSERLFDIRDSLHVAELTLDSWERKYEANKRPKLYLEVLFGREGCQRIEGTLGSIKITTRTIREDVDSVIGRALRASAIRVPSDAEAYDEELIKICLRRIRRNMTWSKKFVWSVLGKADDLEARLRRLHWKLSVLERYSDLYLEIEHPEIFHTVKRLPGRRVILKIDDGRREDIQHKVLDALSVRKDAELLHSAADRTRNQVHIGLSVPQIHRRDFAFLLSLGDQSHEIVVKPVRIKAVYDKTRVQSDIASATSSLIRNTDKECYMLPPTSTSAGFQLSIPPSNILANLEYKVPISTLIRQQNPIQSLYSQDQAALAQGIAQGSFRLLGSQWLQFLDSANIRWRLSREGQWSSMMSAIPGDTSTTRTLTQCLDAAQQGRSKRDLTKHIQIFRIGLVLTELALKTPISYISFDATSGTVKIFIRGLKEDGSDDEEILDAAQIAAQVDRRCNILLGNMVYFCLSVLQDRDTMADKAIETAYFKDVLSPAEELGVLVRNGRRRGGAAGVGGGKR